MAWIAVDEDGREVIFQKKPERDESSNSWWFGMWNDFPHVVVPNGTSIKVIGYQMTWEDEAVEF